MKTLKILVIHLELKLIFHFLFKMPKEKHWNCWKWEYFPVCVGWDEPCFLLGVLHLSPASWRGLKWWFCVWYVWFLKYFWLIAIKAILLSRKDALSQRIKHGWRMSALKSQTLSWLSLFWTCNEFMSQLSEIYFLRWWFSEYIHPSPCPYI